MALARRRQRAAIFGPASKHRLRLARAQKRGHKGRGRVIARAFVARAQGITEHTAQHGIHAGGHCAVAQAQRQDRLAGLDRCVATGEHFIGKLSQGPQIILHLAACLRLLVVAGRNQGRAQIQQRDAALVWLSIPCGHKDGTAGQLTMHAVAAVNGFQRGADFADDMQRLSQRQRLSLLLGDQRL